MFVDVTTKANSISTFKIVPSKQETQRSTNTVLDSDSLTLTLLDHSNSITNFKLFDKQTGKTQTFDFTLKYWPSYVEYDNLEDSGAYVFRPIDNFFYPFPYSELVGAEVQQGDVQSRIVLTYAKQKKGQEQMKAIVYVTIDHDLSVLKFEVDLNSLPEIYLNGYEVVVNF